MTFHIALQSPKWGKVSILRQTSQYSGLTSSSQYFIKDFCINRLDFLLLQSSELYSQINIERNKVVYIYMENPKIWIPDVSFLEKIGILISPYDLKQIIPKHTRFIRSYPCVPWFYGIEFCRKSGLLHKPLRSMLELDGMLKLSYPRKIKLLSMIVSGKAWTPGHSWRRDLSIAVKSYFGDLVDIFGFGHAPIPDKRQAIDPYIFSIVIENESDDYYVTEKVVDCLIGWAIPIYSGSMQLDSLLKYKVPRIPFGCDIDYALSQIKTAVSNGGMSYKQLEQIRKIAIHRLNLFEELPRLLSMK